MSAPKKRRRLSKKQRATLMQKQNGRCCVQGCTETRNLQEEHSTPFSLTGELPDQLMCAEHHRQKTYGSPGRVGGDIRDIHHTKRLAEGRTQHDKRNKRGFSLIRGLSKLVSGGFRKNPNLKRQIGTGKVVPRG